MIVCIISVNSLQKCAQSVHQAVTAHPVHTSLMTTKSVQDSHLYDSLHYACIESACFCRNCALRLHFLEVGSSTMKNPLLMQTLFRIYADSANFVQTACMLSANFLKMSSARMLAYFCKVCTCAKIWHTDFAYFVSDVHKVSNQLEQT
jgi:hypothetical protein